LTSRKILAEKYKVLLNKLPKTLQKSDFPGVSAKHHTVFYLVSVPAENVISFLPIFIEILDQWFPNWAVPPPWWR